MLRLENPRTPYVLNLLFPQTVKLYSFLVTKWIGPNAVLLVNSRYKTENHLRDIFELLILTAFCSFATVAVKMSQDNLFVDYLVRRDKD